MSGRHTSTIFVFEEGLLQKKHLYVLYQNIDKIPEGRCEYHILDCNGESWQQLNLDKQTLNDIQVCNDFIANMFYQDDDDIKKAFIKSNLTRRSWILGLLSAMHFTAAGQTSHDVSITSNVFTPDEISISVGDTVMCTIPREITT